MIFELTKLVRGLWPGVGLLFAPSLYAAEEFSFDASEFEKKPYELNAYTELYYERFQLDQHNAAYILNFLGQPDRNTINRGTGVLELNGKYKKNQFSAEQLNTEILKKTDLIPQCNSIMKGFLNNLEKKFLLDEEIH